MSSHLQLLDDLIVSAEEARCAHTDAAIPSAQLSKYRKVLQGYSKIGL